MGGFLYVAKRPGQSVDDVQRRSKAAIAVHRARALGPERVIDRSGFVLFLFDKAEPRFENLAEFADGDFVVCVGTLLYRGLVGAPALRALHGDFPPDGGSF